VGEDVGPTPEPDAGAEPEEEVRHAPTAPWYGAVVTVSLFLSAAWLLSYTLLDWDWQQRWGAWNYLVALVLSSVPGRMLQHWHGEPHRE
jgi:hypothetical protein